MRIEKPQHAEGELRQMLVDRAGHVKEWAHQAQSIRADNVAYYQDDTLGQLEVYLSAGSNKLEEELSQKELSDADCQKLLRHCDYLAQQFDLFNLRLRLLATKLLEPVPLHSSNDTEQLAQIFRGYEHIKKIAVGVTPKKVKLPPRNGVFEWEEGTGLSMTLLDVQKNHRLLDHADKLSADADDLVMYRAGSLDAFCTALLIKKLVSDDDRLRDMFLQAIKYENGEPGRVTEEVKQLGKYLRDRDITAIVNLVGEKKKGLGALIDELGNQRTDVKSKLYLSQKIREEGFEKLSQEEALYMAYSQKAVLERIIISMLMEKVEIPEKEAILVHLLTNGSGDQTVKWKAGTLLSFTPPENTEYYQKVIQYCRSAFRRSGRAAWYTAFNIAHQGKYPELNETIGTVFAKQNLPPEFEALIVGNASHLFGAQWQEVLSKYRSQNLEINQLITNRLAGESPEITPLELDLDINRDRILGALFGHAIGDSMGAPIEILHLDEIKKLYGTVDDFVEYPYQTLPVGDYTDDTALTIAGMESVLAKRNFDADDYAERLSELAFQMDNGLEPARHFSEGSTMAMRRVGIGQNWRFAGNSSGKNGAAIRMIPLAVLELYDPEHRLKENVDKACEPTHKDELSKEGAYLTALAIVYCLQAKKFDGQELLERLKRAAQTKQFKEKLEILEQLLQQNAPAEEAQKKLGTTSLATETVPYALYCFLRNPYHFKDVLVPALNIEGDSDSIAAIAGSFCGALNGFSKLPPQWVDRLTCKELLLGFLDKK